MSYCYHCMTKLDEVEMPFCPECGAKHSVHESKSFELPAGTTLGEGRYFVGKSIGSNNFSIAYIGFDTKDDEKVVITETFYKSVFKRDVKKDNKDSFKVSYGNEISLDVLMRNTRKECITLSDSDRLKNIVKVKAWFSENNTLYVVSEYIEGETLFDRVKREGAYDWEKLYSYMEPVLNDLAKLHDKNIIHKNIKPQNIMIRKNKKNKDEFVLIDFGIAQPKETESPVKRETSAYAPPEQKNHSQPNGLYTDVFSCAAVIYYSVSGEEPKNETDKETDYLFPLLKPFKKSKKIPDNIYYALKYALQPDYKARCQTLEEFNKRIYTDPGASKTVYIPSEENYQPKKPKKSLSLSKADEDGSSPTVYLPSDRDGSSPTVYMPSDRDGSSPTVYMPSDSDGSSPTVYMPSDSDGSSPTVYMPSDSDGSSPTVYMPNDNTDKSPAFTSDKTLSADMEAIIASEPVFIGSQSNADKSLGNLSNETILAEPEENIGADSIPQNDPAAETVIADPRGGFGETTVLGMTGNLNAPPVDLDPPKPTEAAAPKSDPDSPKPMTREEFFNLPAGNPNGYKTQQNAAPQNQPAPQKNNTAKIAIIAAACILVLGIIAIVIVLILPDNASAAARANAMIGSPEFLEKSFSAFKNLFMLL